MKRGRWSGLGLTALHTAAWLVRWRGDGGQRKAEEAMEMLTTGDIACVRSYKRREGNMLGGTGWA